MKFSRRFIGQKEEKQKDDFIAKMRGLILRDSEAGLSEQLDYQKSDGFRRWLYFTPKFSPSGFAKLTEMATLVEFADSLRPGWEITLET